MAPEASAQPRASSRYSAISVAILEVHDPEALLFLGDLWRPLMLPNRIENSSLTSLQQRLVKTGGGLIQHARYCWLLLAGSNLTRRLFGSKVPLRRVGFSSLARAELTCAVN
jgi:hypothetical protein